MFGVEEIKALSGWEKNRIYNTLSSMNRKDHMVRIKDILKEDPLPGGKGDIKKIIDSDTPA